MDFIRSINWELLRKQKQTLLDVSQKLRDDNSLVINEDEIKQIEHLEGVVALIDALQDDVVDNQGVHETLVFGETKES